MARHLLPTLQSDFARLMSIEQGFKIEDLLFKPTALSSFPSKDTDVISWSPVAMVVYRCWTGSLGLATEAGGITNGGIDQESPQ